MNTTPNTPVAQKLRTLLERLNTFVATLSIEQTDGGVLTPRFRSEPIRLRPTCKELLARIPEVMVDTTVPATVTFRRGNAEPIASGLNSKFKEWVVEHCQRVAAVYFQHRNPLPIEGYILQAQDYLRVVTPLVQERNLPMKRFLQIIDITLFCPQCLTDQTDPEKMNRLNNGLVGVPTVVIAGRPKFGGFDCQIPPQVREPLEQELKDAILELLQEMTAESSTAGATSGPQISTDPPMNPKEAPGGIN